MISSQLLSPDLMCKEGIFAVMNNRPGTYGFTANFCDMDVSHMAHFGETVRKKAKKISAVDNFTAQITHKYQNVVGRIAAVRDANDSIYGYRLELIVT